MLIYKITNNVNGKIYIGQTIRTLEERWVEHCKKTSDCVAIGNAIQKHGKENFVIETIYRANSMDELNEKEREFIDQFYCIRPNGYNLTNGGLNFLRSEETKLKQSIRQTGKGNHNFGKKASPETRAKMSDSHKGENNHFFGKTHTQKTRAVLSGYRKTQKCPRSGTKHSEESLKKMSNSHKGIPAVNRKSVKCNENGQTYESVTLAAKCFGIDPSDLCKHLKGVRKSCKGYTFSYV